MWNKLWEKYVIYKTCFFFLNIFPYSTKFFQYIDSHNRLWIVIYAVLFCLNGQRTLKNIKFDWKVYFLISLNYKLSYLWLSTAKSIFLFREKISICIWKQTRLLRVVNKQLVEQTDFLSKSLSPISSTVIFFYYIPRTQ